MARPSNTAERRSQITGALMHVMAVKGYEGASIAQIARAAGLTQGLIHYHFQNKEAILLALLDQLSTGYLQRLDLAVGGPAAPLQRLDTLLDFHLGLGAHADPDALACWIFLSGQALRSPAVRERFEQALAQTSDRVRGLIAEAAQRGEVGDVDAQACAGAITATIQGYFLLGAAARSVVPRGSALRATRSMVRGLLGLAPGEVGS